MMVSPRWKRLFLIGACGSTLAVILWAAYLFAVIWLRTRYVRELAEQAEPLAEISIADVQEAEQEDTDDALRVGNILWNVEVRNHNALERLESLQQPNVGTVFRHLLGRAGGEETWNSQPAHIAFSLLGQTLATSGSSTNKVQLWNAQTGAPQSGTVAYSVTASPGSANAGQFLFTFAMGDVCLDFQCYAVADSHGEKVLVLTRPLTREPGDEQAAESSPPDREVLLIDTAGRIFARLRCPGAGLVGKLAEPHGKADQLVFGTRTYVNHENGTFKQMVAGPGAICLIEDGQLKMVRSIAGPAAPEGETKPAEPANIE